MAMTNIIARFKPYNPRRVIVATHFDSIVKAYRDTKKPDAPMPGANNSASGVALLLETARVLSEMPEAPPVGIDMIFFDGEEGSISIGAGDPNSHPIGSPLFRRASRRLLSEGQAGEDARSSTWCATATCI